MDVQIDSPAVMLLSELTAYVEQLEADNAAMRHDLYITDGLQVNDKGEVFQIRHVSIMPKPERLEYLKTRDGADFVPYRPEQREHIGYAGAWQDKQGQALAFQDFEGELFFDF